MATRPNFGRNSQNIFDIFFLARLKHARMLCQFHDQQEANAHIVNEQ